MARTAAICLIVVHLMNVIGYYGILANLEIRHQKTIASELDRDEFVGSNAITLRIPFSLPYSTYQPTYERVTGRIEYEGKAYQLVKQKFYNDTLYIVCIKDARLTEIKNAIMDITTSMSNQKPEGKQSGRAVAPLIKDYEGCTAILLNTTLFQLESLRLPDYAFSAKVNVIFPVDQPPKV